MIKIAIYGKGGIGKSTTASNISAALSDMGYRVMQIGCDPKADSVVNLCGGKRVDTILSTLRSKGSNVNLSDLVTQGYSGVMCAETGGPIPGTGCAGRGIVTAFEELEKLNAFEILKPDVVIYDVLGDVVCGGFAMPIRGGYAKNVFVVTSGEKMSIYAAANIALAVENFKERGYARFSGIILNRRNVPDEIEIVEEFAKDSNSHITGIISRSDLVSKAEDMSKTVIEAFPESSQAEEYRSLAVKMVKICQEDK